MFLLRFELEGKTARGRDEDGREVGVMGVEVNLSSTVPSAPSPFISSLPDDDASSKTCCS